MIVNKKKTVTLSELDVKQNNNHFYFISPFKEKPKSSETIKVEKDDQLPHDETASEISIPASTSTSTFGHTIELDRNVTIILGIP